VCAAWHAVCDPHEVVTVESRMPPMLTTEFQMPTSPLAAPAMFHSMIFAPARGSATVKRMSEICATPTSLALPTLTTGTGLLGSLKLAPAPLMTGQASPTMRLPGGMKSVESTTYTP
jgi:hypothetical protein